MSVIEILVERISQDISCEKEVVVLEVIDNHHQHAPISVVQSKGESQSAVMSQKAVSDELTSLANLVSGNESSLQAETQNRVDAVNALTFTLQEETQDRTNADNFLTSEIQRIQQEYNQSLMDLKIQMDTDLSSLRSELLQHLRYSMYLDLPLGGTK